MKKKFKGQVYRDAIEKLDKADGFSCNAVYFQSNDREYEERYSKFFSGYENKYNWGFDYQTLGSCIHDAEYDRDTELGRRTREIALELAAHLEDIGEMDRILGEK